jgi:isoleucyl-tRNA synthetase
VGADGTLATGYNLPGEGIPVKKKNDKNRYAVDDLIIENLKSRGLLFKAEAYEHEYPFCWRCDTPLIYFAKPSWFIRMSAVREELVKNGETIAWVPEHIREGRFGEWLRGIKDWAISRDRYWGTPLPIWECEQCAGREIFSSVSELEKLSGAKLADVHKPYIDDITWLCACGGTMRRTPEVLDVWFDSGAMPLAQFNYPHAVTNEDKVAIEAGKYFPADYICEAIDQTRGWFYTLHAIATLLAQAGVVREGRAYKNVICLGHVLDGNGKKMSKSKGNVIDPFAMFDTYGADMLRWALFSVNQPGLPKRFDDKVMRDVQNRVFRMLWNSYSFFMTYAAIDGWTPESKADHQKSSNVLDRWILSELQLLVKSVDESLTNYDVYGPTQKIEAFIDNLSNWYIRRNRKRFWKPARHAARIAAGGPARMMESGGSEDDADKNEAYRTLYDVLVTLAKLMAPFTPFLAEEMYRNLMGEASVHLAKWPRTEEGLVDGTLNEEMRAVRELVTEGLKLRAEAKVKVRQPLATARVKQAVSDEAREILAEELNVKDVAIDASLDVSIVLGTEITPELKLEGEAREIIRAIQEGRKQAGFNVEDRITLGYEGMAAVFAEATLKDMIAKDVLATETTEGPLPDAEHSGTASIDGETFMFTMKRAK